MKNTGWPLDNQTWQTEWKPVPLAKVQLCEYENQTFQAFVVSNHLCAKWIVQRPWEHGNWRKYPSVMTVFFWLKNHRGPPQLVCNCVYIYIWQLSSLGHPHCALSICHYLPYSIHFSEFMPSFSQEKTDKIWKHLKFNILVWYKNGHQWLLGVQSINTQSLFKFINDIAFALHSHFLPVYS